MGAIRNLFDNGIPWAPDVFRLWGEGISDIIDNLVDVNPVTEGDPRLTDARTPLFHGNEAHNENFVRGTGVDAIVAVTESNYPLSPVAGILYVVFPD